MEKITPPRVTLLTEGGQYMTKQMEAKAGDLLPVHSSDLESVLFVHEGECILRINNEEIELRAGQAFTIPQFVKHQIKAVTAFKGVHFIRKTSSSNFLDKHPLGMDGRSTNAPHRCRHSWVNQ